MGRHRGGQQKCLCIQSVSSSICCLGSTKRRRKKRHSALHCRVKSSAVQRAKAETGSLWPLLLLASRQCTKGQSRCCCPRPPFNLGLRAAHIRGEPCNPPPSHLLAVSSLAHNFPPAVPLSQILLISTLQHPTHLAHAS